MVSGFALLLAAAWMTAASVTHADDDDHHGQCAGLPGHSALQGALDAAVATETSGLDFDMWATVVNRDGVVCAVAFSGNDRGS